MFELDICISYNYRIWIFLCCNIEYGKTLDIPKISISLERMAFIKPVSFEYYGILTQEEASLRKSMFSFCSFQFYLYIFVCVGSSLLCAGVSLWWLLLVRSTGSRHTGFSSCGTQAQ